MQQIEQEDVIILDKSYKMYIYIDENDTRWFKGNEIAHILNFKAADNALRSHVSPENRKPWSLFENDSSAKPDNWQPKTIMINESGCYELLLRALPQVRRWIANSVMPQIYRTGGYETPKDKKFLDLMGIKMYD